MVFPFADNIRSSTVPWVTYALIAANTAAFLYQLQLNEQQQEEFVLEHALVPARVSQWNGQQPVIVPGEIIERRRERGVPVAVRRAYSLETTHGAIVLSLLTTMFLHGGWMHLLSNMWFLYLFGDNVEDRLGHLVYLIFYLIGGLAASLFHWIADPQSLTPVIGASGAIASVLGGYAVTWPWARVRSVVFLVVFVTVVELPALLVLGIWFLTQLLEAREAVNLGVDGGVAWWAHVGGFLFGAVTMPLVATLVDGLSSLGRSRPTHDDDWHEVGR